MAEQGREKTGKAAEQLNFKYSPSLRHQQTIAML
jgi:hypothetical protein